ncbi:glutaredoxin-like protein [Magnetococcus marinus MC-1]|uniref:Glutaredoxin n=1 Tax=Magnetococcus marinus (strain ATCC BAA-1437 / JCM 17883 / MC-1) TaxID=156889 RepID=A0L4I7_MAGMM|nr:Grx4 family monothiol glutaredoxin [Magnetococcus marinus]ABK42880.1 glutaredoxin-like protein [Magnetococcus marinus MC-1]
MSDIQATIQEHVNSHAVVLYMKGNPSFPQCGFSGAAAKMLAACDLSNDDFLAVDVLMNPDIREGIKAFANWPTIPQLYIKGQFVGGADIMREMYQSGDLKTQLDAALGR